MRVVRLLDILVSYLLVLLCAAGIVAGVFDVRYFIGAGAALAAYLVWGYFRLRCPWCGEPVDSGKLLRGLRRSCNCPNCGHEIIVVPFVSRGAPAKLRRSVSAPARKLPEPEPEAEPEPKTEPEPEEPGPAETEENERRKSE